MSYSQASENVEGGAEAPIAVESLYDLTAIAGALFESVATSGGFIPSIAEIRKLIEDRLGDCACRIVVQDPRGPLSTGGLLHSDSGWFAAKSIDLAFPGGADPLVEAMQAQEWVRASDVFSLPDHAEHAAKASIARWRAFTAAPFQLGALKGALAVYRRTADAQFMRDSVALADLARTVALALALSRVRPEVDTPNFDDALNKLSKAIPGVVYRRQVFPNGDIRYTYISESAREFFGVEPERILKDPEALFQHYDPEYRASFREKLLEASRNLSSWDVEATIRLPDGSLRYTHAIARPELIDDGSVVWTGVILDAGRIKAAERVAAEAEARTRSNIVEGLSQGFLLFDANDRLIVANSYFYDLFPTLKGVIQPGCSFEEFARSDYELAASQALDKHNMPMRPLQRMRCRDHGKSVSERRCGDDRWLMVSEHRTEDRNTVVLFTDVSELKQRERRINHLAYHDSLTGLPNRVYFRQKLDETIARCARLGRQVGVMCLDLDRFKFVNDTLGHPAGDELLIQVASRLRNIIRAEDTAARLGGDEFAIILEISGQNYASDVAWRIIAALGTPFDLGDNSIVTSASIGIAESKTLDEISGEALIKRADLALYRAKSEGRDRFRFFEEEMDEAAQQRRLLEIDLRMALAKDQLIVYYQPLVESSSGEIMGMEALVRWRHPVRGLVPPSDFILLAEETGLISKIGEWVLRRACLDAAAWPAPIRVAVNLSPAQFRDVHFCDTVRRCLLESGLPAERLELEVTESLLLRDTAENLNILSEIRALGVRIAMDDFGTGYSSLANLRSFPFDKIKIDKSFVQDIGSEEDSVAIVRAVLGLAKGLGMVTTAEGVETQRQLDYLVAEGCTEVQGFLFSRPFPVEDVRHFMAKNVFGCEMRDRHSDHGEIRGEG